MLHCNFLLYRVIALAKTPSIMLKRSGEEDLLVLFLILVGKLIVSHHCTLTRGIPWILFIKLRTFPSIPTILIVFMMNCYWIFVKNFFPTFLIFSCDFFLLPVDVID